MAAKKSSRWKIGERENNLCLLKEIRRKVLTLAKLAKERVTCTVETGVKNKNVQNYSVQCNGYNLIGVTTVERGDGSYDSTSLFPYIRQLL
jgi:hypothetical protein